MNVNGARGEAWSSLGEATNAAVTQLLMDARALAVIVGMPVEQLCAVLADGGSLALAERIARILDDQVTELRTCQRDLLATIEAVRRTG